MKDIDSCASFYRSLFKNGIEKQNGVASLVFDENFLYRLSSNIYYKLRCYVWTNGCLLVNRII